jgi:hypothetical protein
MKNKIKWKVDKEFEKLIAQYKKEKSILFLLKFDKALKKVVSEDI